MEDPRGDLLDLELEAGWPRLLATLRARRRWLALVFAEPAEAAALRQRLGRALLERSQDLLALTLPADRDGALNALLRSLDEGPAPNPMPCRWAELPQGGASLAARLVELETLAPALEARAESGWRRALLGGLVLHLPSAARAVVEQRTPQLAQAADVLLGGELATAEGEVSVPPDPEDALERAGLALTAARGARARGVTLRVRGQALRALAALEPLAEPPAPLLTRALDVLAHAEHDLADPAACLDHVQAWLARLDPLADDTPRDTVRAHVLGARAERLLAGEEQPRGLGLEHAKSACDEARRLYAKDPVFPGHARLLSLALDVLGLVYRDAGENEQAFGVQQEAVELDRALVEATPDDPVLLRNLSVGLERLGDTLRLREHVQQAALCYAECLALREGLLAADERDPGALHEVFEVLWRVASLGESSGQANAADTLRTLYTARGYLQRAQLLAPDSPRLQRDLAALEDWLRELEGPQAPPEES